VRLNMILRVLLVIGAVLLIFPNKTLDLIGYPIVFLIYGTNYLASRKVRAVAVKA